MASTFSPILRIELIGTGDQSGTWGNTTNINLGTLIEQAIAGTATIDVSVGNVTLSNFNGVTDEARCMALRVTGTPGTSRNIIAPAVSKFYIIANGSDAAVVLKTSTSTGLNVPVGEVLLAYYDPTVGTTDFRLVGRASASANTPNTLVLRDGSGNFAAGVITATGFTGPIGVGTPAAALFTSMSTSGNTIIGDSSADTLTVNATPTFNVAIPVTSGGTGVTTSTGTGSVVRATSPTLVTPALGTPTSGNLSSCTDLPIIAGTTGTLSVARGGTGSTSASTGTGGVVLAISPALTGTPTAPTANTGSNTTQLATTAFVQNTIPSGVIVMWSGSIAAIPSGWFLCNGGNGTPDLRDRFVGGAGGSFGVGATGGSADAIVVAHSHSATSTVSDPGHVHNYGTKGVTNNQNSPPLGFTRTGTPLDTIVDSSLAFTGISVATSIASAGSSGTNANLPPFYALAYIMKA
jgi:hypothetical protein